MLVLIVKLVTFVLSATSYAQVNCPETCDCRQLPNDSDVAVINGDQHRRTVTDGDDNNSVLIAVTCTGNVQHETLPDSIEVLRLRNMPGSDVNRILSALSGNVKDIIVTDVNLANGPFAFNFAALARLRSVKLTRCSLASSPKLILSNATIRSLDLSGNELRSFSGESIQTLEVLNLSANAIDSLNANSFVGLIALKSLDLTANALGTIDDRVLKPLVSLQHLNLSRNRLETLNEASFASLLHLQQLDVSWNRLAKVAPGSLQLPSLARLLLAGNPNLGNFQQPALLVGTGRRLQTVDASRTGLKQVPAALTHSIRTLRLAGNSITAVNCGDLDSYPLLQLLDFTSNNLASVEDDALGRLDSLHVLYLTDNKLRSIPRSLPERLRVLHLEKNKIERIRNGDLLGLPLLEVLLLGENDIKTVAENSFVQLTSLETLDMSANPINTLKAGLYAGPTRLRVLRLARIDAIPPAKEMSFPLSSPEHLVVLDLSRSPGLARQLLADTAVLAAAHELQELDLSDSLVSRIRSDLLHFLPQLRVFRLHGNPLNCSDLQWLAGWMRKQDDAEYRSVVCVTPHELWGTLLVDLLDDDDEEEASDSFVTESAINQNDTNVSYYETRGGRMTTTNVVDITITATVTNPATIPIVARVYNTSGNETSMKLSKMNDDDETSTANYITHGGSKSSITTPVDVTTAPQTFQIYDGSSTTPESVRGPMHQDSRVNDDDKGNPANSDVDNLKLLTINNNNNNVSLSYNANATRTLDNESNEIIKKHDLNASIASKRLKSLKNSTKLNAFFADERHKNEINLTVSNGSSNSGKSNNSNFVQRKELNENITNLWMKNFKLFRQTNTKNATTTRRANESILQNGNGSTGAEDYKKILDKEISSTKLLSSNVNNSGVTFAITSRLRDDKIGRNNATNMDRNNSTQYERTYQYDDGDEEKNGANETIFGHVKTIAPHQIGNGREEDVYDESNVTSSSAANGKMSMYSGGVHHQLMNGTNRFAHPGMLILIIGIVLAALALITVTSRFSWLRSRTHKTYNGNDARSGNSMSGSDTLESVEVSSMTGVTELW